MQNQAGPSRFLNDDSFDAKQGSFGDPGARADREFGEFFDLESTLQREVNGGEFRFEYPQR